MRLAGGDRGVPAGIDFNNLKDYASFMGGEEGLEGFGGHDSDDEEMPDLEN